MPSLNTGNAILSNPIKVDSSYNVGIGGAASGSYKLQVTGTTNLTGALSGTSATFSGTVEAPLFFANAGGSLFLQSASDAISIRQNSTSNNLTIKFNRSGVDLWKIQTVPNGANEDFKIFNSQNSTNSLTIASTGAATFSSSVTADSLVSNGGGQINTTVSPFVFFNSGGGGNAKKFGLNMTNLDGFKIYSLNDNGTTRKDNIIFANIDGNVGIGTSSPLTILHLNSPAGTNATLYFGVNGTGNGYLGQAASSGSLSSGAAVGDVVLRSQTNLLFASGGDTERMRITSVGKLLVGTSTAGYGLFTEQRMTLNPTNDGITVAPLTQNKSAYTLQADNNTGNRYGLYIANGSSSEVGSVSFTSSAVSFNTTSDYRLKQDLKEFKGLDLISAINTYDFEWKIDGTRSYGVIAHELQEVIPYVVIGDKDGDKLQSVDYSKIVPILVKAIQEQQAQIEAQQQTINSLINR